MNILFSTGSLYYLPLKEIFLVAKEAGFDGCDLVITGGFGYAHYREILQECIGILPVGALHVPFQKLPSWGNQIDALIRSIHVAKEFKIPVVTFHPPSWFHLEIRFIRWFRGVRDFQKELGCKEVCVAIENMPLMKKGIRLAPYLLNDFKSILEFGVDRNLYFTFDTTHLGTFDHDLVRAFLTLFKTGRIRHTHLSDYSPPYSHLFPGGGGLPIVRLLNTMKAVAYTGTISLEVSPWELPATREWLVTILSYASSFLKLQTGREKDA